jgi:hypothetical protein
MKTRILNENTESTVSFIDVVAIDEVSAQEAAQSFLESKYDAGEYNYSARSAFEIDTNEMMEDEILADMKVFRVKYDC